MADPTWPILRKGWREKKGFQNQRHALNYCSFSYYLKKEKYKIKILIALCLMLDNDQFIIIPFLRKKTEHKRDFFYYYIWPREIKELNFENTMPCIKCI